MNHQESLFQRISVSLQTRYELPLQTTSRSGRQEPCSVKTLTLQGNGSYHFPHPFQGFLQALLFEWLAFVSPTHCGEILSLRPWSCIFSLPVQGSATPLQCRFMWFFEEPRQIFGPEVMILLSGSDLLWVDRIIGTPADDAQDILPHYTEAHKLLIMTVISEVC